jgi:hypothetical protein
VCRRITHRGMQGMCSEACLKDSLGAFSLKRRIGHGLNSDFQTIRFWKVWPSFAFPSIGAEEMSGRGSCQGLIRVYIHQPVLPVFVALPAHQVLMTEEPDIHWSAEGQQRFVSACRSVHRGAGHVSEIACPSGARAVRQVDAAKEDHVCANKESWRTLQDTRGHGA